MRIYGQGCKAVAPMKVSHSKGCIGRMIMRTELHYPTVNEILLAISFQNILRMQF